MIPYLYFFAAFAVTGGLAADQSPLVENPLLVGAGGSDYPVKPGTGLRILCAGDSITAGLLSDSDGGDGNGFRLRLRHDLRMDNIVFAGTETVKSGNMSDGYFAAWPGKTIEYITRNINPSLKQRPNIILLHAGTNDMSSDGAISTEGNDPVQASRRLGILIDKLVAMCPDAVVLVAMIIDTCDTAQSVATKTFQTLIPSVAQQRLDDGKHVLAVNLTLFPTGELRDCIHPTHRGYALLGDYWANALTQVPKDWIQPPIGPDPDRSSSSVIIINSTIACWPLVLLILALVHMYSR